MMADGGCRVQDGGCKTQDGGWMMRILARYTNHLLQAAVDNAVPVGRRGRLVSPSPVHFFESRFITDLPSR